MTDQFNETADGVPISDGFDFPVGPRGDNVDVFKTHKIDATVADPAYFKLFNVWHTGEDWNGRGGGDTDLGDPIYAISHGKVVEFGNYPPSWGNIILLEHALPDGTRVWSQYAHLDRIMVGQVGQKIKRDQQIGTMGKGAKTARFPQGRWIAHLHFEIRRNKLPIGNWTPMVQNRDQVLANYISPTPFINARRPGTFAQQTQQAAQKEQAQAQTTQTTQAQPQQVMVDSQPANQATTMGIFRMANVDHWYTAPYGFNGSMLWTFAASQTEANWGEWHPYLPVRAKYHVWAFVPEQHASTTQARYKVIHADGQNEVVIDQSQHRHKWAYLGTYWFDPRGGYVRLSDLTGEQTQGQPPMVGFDTVTWVKVD
jgi:hypothetical protein